MIRPGPIEHTKRRSLRPAAVGVGVLVDVAASLVGTANRDIDIATTGCDHCSERVRDRERAGIQRGRSSAPGIDAFASQSRRLRRRVEAPEPPPCFRLRPPRRARVGSPVRVEGLPFG